MKERPGKPDNTASLDRFFQANSCAIIGASANPTKAGHQILNNMLSAGFPGSIYPVNPRATRIANLPCYPSLTAIPGQVDLVIITTASATIDRVAADIEQRCREKADLRAVIITGAGFAETGTDEGCERQKLLINCCRRNDLRAMGPNCIGIIDNHHHIDTTFLLGTSREPGGIGFVSQSGAMGAWLGMIWSSQPRPIGFGKFVSLGNIADVDLVEMVHYLGTDPLTSVIGLYLEGDRQARRLMETLREIVPKKPIVVLKVGRTDQGRAAAHSHTGSMAGADRIYDGVFRQYGVLRANSVEELSDTLQAFDHLPLPRGNHAFLITQAGGPGVYCADALAQAGGIQFAAVAQATKEALRLASPPFASVCQPEGHLDISPGATARQHAEVVEIALRDEAVDALLLIALPVMFMSGEALADELIQAITRVRASGINKPFLPVIMAGEWVRESRRRLGEAGILTFETPDRAARALANMVAYQKFCSSSVSGG